VSAPGHWRLAIGGRFRPTTEACEVCGSTVDLRFLCDGSASSRWASS
jgi:hypothetical protein